MLIGMLPTSTLLIGYYHGLLLRDTNVDSLIGDMYSTGLLSTQEQNTILSGHSSHYRNFLLLEYVRHMDAQDLLVFSALVKDVWPWIGMQLVTGIYVYNCDYLNGIIIIINNVNNYMLIYSSYVGCIHSLSCDDYYLFLTSFGVYG